VGNPTELGEGFKYFSSSRPKYLRLISNKKTPNCNSQGFKLSGCIYHFTIPRDALTIRIAFRQIVEESREWGVGNPTEVGDGFKYFPPTSPKYLWLIGNKKTPNCNSRGFKLSGCIYHFTIPRDVLTIRIASR
jgi:sarcosine oxidase delta subunit